MTSLHIAGQTDVGQHRKDNQDTFVSQPLWSASDALLVVIDGVGGYAGGAQAAALAQEAIVQYMAAPTGDTLSMLREAVVHANNQIIRQKKQEPALARMCCVLTAVVADADARRLQYVHVGDTRLYRFREQQLEKLTRDHSLVGVREDANQLTEYEAMNHPRRNEILRDVGSVTHRVDDADFLESGEADFLPGDVLLLCSDGLTDMLTRAELTDVLTRSMPVDEQITELIRQANEQGGHDNITVVLAHYPLPTDAPFSDSRPPALPTSAHEPPAGPVPARTPVTGQPASTAEPVSARSPMRGLLLFLLAVVLAGALWWQYEPTETIPAPRRVVPADSSVTSSRTQPDSILRTP